MSLERAIAFSRAFDERRAERIVPAPHGKMILTPSLPLVYHRNHYSVDLGADASAQELIDEMEPVFATAGLAHRKITIDEDLGARVAPGFRERGWKVEELLVMVHGGEAPDLDISQTEEADPAELEPVWIEGMRAEISNEEEIRQLVAAQHARRAGAHVRYFATHVDDRIASYCELFSDGSTGQIESVMTLEPFRGRGLAKAIVARALAESQRQGDDVTFLVADADDWPKELYRKLGFEAVGSMWDLLRK